ncbi:MAG TPA: PEP-CTERM sorting domain-containing protein [Chthoniobacteraceae bacterium]|jgi:hypothetical protein
MKHLRLPLIAAALFTCAPASHGILSFSFTYLDQNQGFNDPQLGQQRRSAFENAALTLGSFFVNTAVLTFSVNGSEQNDDVLAAAGSGMNIGAAGFFNTFAQGKAISNGLTDGNGNAADGDVTWNFQDHAWDYDDTIDPNQFDFKSTVIHELIHALGFSSNIDSSGRGLEEKASGQPDVFSTFDRFLTNQAQQNLVNLNTFAFDTSKQSTLTSGGTNNPAQGVHFSGANARAANGGAPVPIFSPTPYENGSSGSHLSDTFYNTTDLLMEAATLPGQGPRSLSAIEIGILKDLGYTMVPEPGSLVLLGFASATILGLRRSRRSA